MAATPPATATSTDISTSGGEYSSGARSSGASSETNQRDKSIIGRAGGCERLLRLHYSHKPARTQDAGAPAYNVARE
jgi:hypothetical protein